MSLTASMIYLTPTKIVKMTVFVNV